MSCHSSKNKTLSKKQLDCSFLSSDITNIGNEEYISQIESEEKKHEPNYKQNFNESLYKKKKIVILADQQGRGMQRALQKLVGSEYEVSCFWKSEAYLGEVLNTCKGEIGTLSEKDFIVVIGGMNDKKPSELKINLLEWLSTNVNTSIIICGLPNNSTLYYRDVNYDVKMISQGFAHTTFVKMNYGKSRQTSKFFTSNLSFSIYREMLHSTHTFFLHRKSHQVSNKSSVDEFRTLQNGNSMIIENSTTKNNKSIHKSNNSTFLETTKRS